MARPPLPSTADDTEIKEKFKVFEDLLTAEDEEEINKKLSATSDKDEDDIFSLKTVEQIIQDKDSYYSILGLTKEASDIEIKRAYKKLALKYHPDKHKENAKAIFQIISEAYVTLADKDKKKAYDLTVTDSKKTDEFQNFIRSLLRIINPDKADIPITSFSNLDTTSSIEIGCKYRKSQSLNYYERSNLLAMMNFIFSVALNPGDSLKVSPTELTLRDSEKDNKSSRLSYYSGQTSKRGQQQITSAQAPSLETTKIVINTPQSLQPFALAPSAPKLNFTLDDIRPFQQEIADFKTFRSRLRFESKAADAFLALKNFNPTLIEQLIEFLTEAEKYIRFFNEKFRHTKLKAEIHYDKNTGFPEIAFSPDYLEIRKEEKKGKAIEEGPNANTNSITGLFTNIYATVGAISLQPIQDNTVKNPQFGTRSENSHIKAFTPTHSFAELFQNSALNNTLARTLDSAQKRAKITFYAEKLEDLISGSSSDKLKEFFQSILKENISINDLMGQSSSKKSIVELALTAGIDLETIKIVCDQQGVVIKNADLILAAKYCDREVVEYLYNLLKEPDLNQIADEHGTLIQNAIRKIEPTSTINGISLEQQTEGKIILGEDAQAKRLGVVDFLISKGVSPYVKHNEKTAAERATAIDGVRHMIDLMCQQHRIPPSDYDKKGMFEDYDIRKTLMILKKIIAKSQQSQDQEKKPYFSGFFDLHYRVACDALQFDRDKLAQDPANAISFFQNQLNVLKTEWDEINKSTQTLPSANAAIATQQAAAHNTNKPGTNSPATELQENPKRLKEEETRRAEEARKKAAEDAARSAAAAAEKRRIEEEKTRAEETRKREEEAKKRAEEEALSNFPENVLNEFSPGKIKQGTFYGDLIGGDGFNLTPPEPPPLKKLFREIQNEVITNRLNDLLKIKLEKQKSLPATEPTAQSPTTDPITATLPNLAEPKLKLYHPDNISEDDKRFDFSSTNDEYFKDKPESFIEILKKIFEESRKSCGIEPIDAAIATVIAIQNQGLGRSEEARKVLRTTLEKIYNNKIPANKENDIYRFSRFVQLGLDNATLYTANENAKKLVGMRLKRIDPDLLPEIFSDSAEVIAGLKKYFGEEVLQNLRENPHTNVHATGSNRVAAHDHSRESTA